MYAKLIDSELTTAPKYLTVNELHVWNASASEYIAQGWYPVIYTEAPETDEHHYAESSWEQESDCIRQTWTVVEIPKPQDDDELDEAQAMAVLLGEKL